jgi:hypothetical protein
VRRARRRGAVAAAAVRRAAAPRSAALRGDGAALEWTWLGAPYLAAALLVLVGGAVAAVTRGDRVLRVGLLGAASAVTPWSLATAVALCARDPQTAMRLHQVALGATMMLGPSLLLILLSVSGQLDRFRRLARLAMMSGALLMLTTWSTPWFVDGVWLLPSRSWYPTAGPLAWLQMVQVVSWSALGSLVALRAVPAASRTAMSRYVAALPVLAVVATADTALSYGLGALPSAWLPALLGALLSLHLLLRTPLLRADGVDRSALLELGCYVAAAAGIAALLWVATTRGVSEPVTLAALGAPLWGAALWAAWQVPRRRPLHAGGRDTALEQLSQELAQDTSLVEPVRRLWAEYVGLSDVVLREDLSALSADARRWLSAAPAPVVRGELGMLRLGALRRDVEASFGGGHASVLVPIVYRGELIAVLEARQATPGPLRDVDRLLLFDSAQRVGDAVVYQRLVRDATAAAESAREVELATELAKVHRPSFEEQQGPWQLAVRHLPSGGAGWSWAPLRDGRIAAMIAEAEAPGVAGTLGIAALQGAFAARCQGESCDAGELLAALRGAVTTFSRRTLVLVLDAGAGQLSWAGDGHVGAAVLDGDEAKRLEELGEPSGGVAALSPTAMVVLMSSAVLDAGGLAAARQRDAPRDLRLLAALVGAGVAASSESGALTRRSSDLLAVGFLQRHASASAG